MRASSYQKLLDELAKLDAAPEAKRQFEELLRRNAAMDGIACLQRDERVGFASHLLTQKEDRSVIRERLMARFQVSRSQAYADISEAMRTVQKPTQRLDGGQLKWEQ